MTSLQRGQLALLGHSTLNTGSPHQPPLSTSEGLARREPCFHSHLHVLLVNSQTQGAPKPPPPQRTPGLSPVKPSLSVPPSASSPDPTRQTGLILPKQYFFLRHPLPSPSCGLNVLTAAQRPCPLFPGACVVPHSHFPATELHWLPLVLTQSVMALFSPALNCLSIS